jgi:hypothetical protein
MFTKFLSIPVFIISLAVGLFFVYMTQSPSKVIYVYPTPDNQHEFQYKDEASNCFSFKQHEVECPSDDSLIQSIPIQHNQK